MGSSSSSQKLCDCTIVNSDQNCSNFCSKQLQFVNTAINSALRNQQASIPSNVLTSDNISTKIPTIMMSDKKYNIVVNCNKADPNSKNKYLHSWACGAGDATSIREFEVPSNPGPDDMMYMGFSTFTFSENTSSKVK